MIQVKVFISWSGSVSHRVSLVLRDWIPSVIQSLEPYVSSEDIDKGARWSTDIAEELSGSNYGILVVTKTNVGAPWLNFEAGALSKAFDSARVSPFLIGIKRSEVEGPLLQFQSTTYDKDDVFKLMAGLNSACDSSLDAHRLDEVLEVWWPSLESKLAEIDLTDDDSEQPGAVEGRDEAGILEEVLDLVRSQQRLLNSPEELLPPGYLAMILEDRDSGRRMDREWHIGGHPAFDDLADGFRQLRRAISELPDSGEADLVRDVLRSVEGPLDFLVGRYGLDRGRLLRP